MSKQDQYQHHLHVLRGVAITLICCAHTLPSLDWSNHPALGRWIDALANESSVIFFFIAGYLFQHLSGRFSFPKYLKQKLKTVILPYLLLSIPAIFVFTVLVQRIGMWGWFYDLPRWQQAALFLLTGKHLAPLWFVPTIAMFYLLAPVFLWIDRSRPRLYWAILPLMLLSTYIGRDGPYGPIDKAIYLLPVYMLGMAFSRYRNEAMALVRRWAWALTVVAVLTMAGYVLDWPTPPHWLLPAKAALSLLLTMLLYRWHMVFRGKLDYLAEVSFGVFFIHAYFISAIKVVTTYLVDGRIYNGEGVGVIPGNVFTFTLYVGAVILLSLATIWLAKRVLGARSRMFNGA